MADTENQAQAPREDETHADIYGEDGAVRASFLAHIGAAVADRDVLTLTRDIDSLHQS